MNRRWATLSDLLHELPQASRTWEAVMNDPELAGQLHAAQNRDAHLDPDSDAGDDFESSEPKLGWRPLYRDHDLHAKMLGDLINAVAGMNQTVITIATGKGRKVDPYPVPETALPQVELDQARADGDAILAMLGMDNALPGDD